VARSSLGTAGPTSAYKAPKVKRQNPILKYVAIVFVVVALAGAGWYTATYMGWIGKKDAAPTQEETLAAEKKNTAAADGGADQSGQAPAAPTNAPMVAPVWSLNPKGVKISDGKANGSISGTHFVVENARLTKTANGHLLSLSEGSGPSPMHEFQVFLRLGATDTVTNHTWSITPEMTGASVAPVVKRWKTDPRFAPQSKTFSSGYALQLEMGTPGEDGQIPGKIFLSLPDQEQSVVAGTFKANSAIVQAVQQQQPAEVTQPPAGMDPAMRRRYNLK